MLSASSLQLSGVPSPTTVSGLEVSTGLAATSQGELLEASSTLT
jgi:hypothetical protein